MTKKGRKSKFCNNLQDFVNYNWERGLYLLIFYILKYKNSIQLKAAFLLIIFGLNTAVGFACAIGIDMGFNISHHHNEEATGFSVHIHADGKKHHHPDEANEHHNDKKDTSKKDDCCNDKAVKLLQTDKAVPQSHSLSSPIFSSAFISSYYNVGVLYPSPVITSIKYFVRSYHPPIPDIRIAIQSFQI